LPQRLRVQSLAAPLGWSGAAASRLLVASEQCVECVCLFGDPQDVGGLRALRGDPHLRSGVLLACARGGAVGDPDRGAILVCSAEESPRGFDSSGMIWLVCVVGGHDHERVGCWAW